MPQVSLVPRRRVFPWIVATALVVLAAMSAARFLTLRQELHAQVASQLEAQIHDRVSTWEDGILGKLEEWLDVASASPAEAWLAEVQMRQRESWFDSLYLWRPRRIVAVRGQVREEAAAFLFPLAAPSEGLHGVTRAPCLRPSEIGLTAGDPHLLAEAYLHACGREVLPVRLFASSRAAVLLARQGDFDAAVKALDTSGLDPVAPMRYGIQRGLDPYRLGIQRLQRAEYLMKLGRESEGLDVYQKTGLEITALDAPEIADLLQYVREPILGELRRHGRDEQATRIEQALLQAERRARAYEEIGQRILPRPPPQATEAPRFIYDQYSAPPFLLFYGPVRNGEMEAALQLDQPLLLADFLSTMKRYREHLAITDGTGAWVAGAGGSSAVVVEVPFSRTLTHLRVGLRQEALSERMERLDDQWVIPMVVILMCVILGAVALAAQIRADRQQQQLLLRQREFTARVTHELKTPLAGIKVMAENLESGIYDSPTDEREMARSIVQEADRLAARVEEILSVSKARKLPTPEPFDPEEVILEAIDLWGPRLEKSGVKLKADLHPTDSIVGDASSVRDAVGCLLDNALKYRREGGTEATVWLTLTQEGREVVVEVTDNGLGVPPAMREAVFERFVRVEGPNRGKAGGHGLGLAQVREAAEAHKGSVVCLDGVDGGARFVLRLRR